MAGHAGDARGQRFDESKPCRTCVDFTTWMKQQQKQTSDSAKKVTEERQQENLNSQQRTNCPLDKDELGRSTWAFLHTTAAYLPEQLSTSEQSNLQQFVRTFAQFYPCPPCAEDLRQDINQHPPVTETRLQFAQWLCERHNTVNRKLHKKEFDCKLLDQRWRDGWSDGSCD